MGGGDLNTKKSWHPNKIKNQEKVWKAEQQQAHENKRMDDLRKEISSERVREELNQLGQSSGVLTDKPNKKLDWMYKEPNQNVDREQYLLGKAIDKTFEKLVAEEKSSQSLLKTSKNHVEHECIPFSIRNFRNGAVTTDNQVDMARKLLEDPLVAIRKREVESRAQLLQNPVKLKELSMLLKADEQKHKMKKDKKKQKKKRKEKDELEHKIFAKLKKLDNNDLNIDIKRLLSSETSDHIKKKKKRSKETSDSDSDSDSSSPKKRKKHKSKRSHDKKEKSQDRDEGYSNKYKHSERDDSKRLDRHYANDEKKEKCYGLSRPDGSRYQSTSKSSSSNLEENKQRSASKGWVKPQRKHLSEQEKEEKRREMMKDAVKRDSEREKNISYYKSQDKMEEMKNKDGVPRVDFVADQLRAVAGHGSVESRIKSNIYNIQRSNRDMDRHFAKR